MTKDLSNKKEQFTQPQKSKMPLIVGILTIILAIGIFMMFAAKGQEEVTGNYFGDPVVSPRSYIGELISMTSIEPVVEDGKIIIPLDVIDEYNIVSFELENNENLLVPLMAYITPSGRLFVGSSMCEPCRGRTFTLAGETLVCDACRTTYDIEDHEFIAGSRTCGSYPPVNLNPKIEGDRVIIDLDNVLNWRIRS